MLNDWLWGLMQEDEDEDFMDESTVNKEGRSTTTWPPVLKFVVCQLLMEITAYIRETYKAVPKVRQHKTWTVIPKNGFEFFSVGKYNIIKLDWFFFLPKKLNFSHLYM